MLATLRWTVLGLAALVATLVASGPGMAAAQDNPGQQPRFGEFIEVREVLLDALVTDPRGHVIVGLGKNDFVVRMTIGNGIVWKRLALIPVGDFELG